MEKQTKGLKIKRIVILLILILAAAAFIFYAFLMKPYQRVLLAAKNTFGSKNYGGYILRDGDDFLLSGRIKTMGQSLGFKTALTKDKVLISLPGLSDKLFTYDYRNDNNGYFPDKLGKKNLALFGKMLASVYDTENADNASKAVKTATSFLKSLPQGELEKKAITVGKHSEDCKGYYFDTEQGRISCYIFRGKLVAIENEDGSFFMENEIIHLGEDFTAKIQKTEKTFTLTGEEFDIGNASRADFEAIVLERIIKELN